jgi:hypothetical protein
MTRQVSVIFGGCPRGVRAKVLSSAHTPSYSMRVAVGILPQIRTARANAERSHVRRPGQRAAVARPHER